jgi:hypothetical protein
MHAQLPRDGADRPVLGVMQAQDLGFERTRDQRWRLASWSAVQKAPSREARQAPGAETTAR